MLQPGTILDNKFQIEAPIGQGGFGYVYRARERLTGETVAIKELVPAFVDSPEMVQRFIQEARATLRLTHPNIVRTYGIFEDQGTYYLVMEYLGRGSLADALKQRPPPTKEAVRIATELCEALAYAHREGLIHCDIKPANVLFDEKGRVRLADFGIAHVSAEMMTRQLFTATGTAMGTVRYMAPEQLEGVRNDPRLDIYALGTLLYEMLAGRPYLDFETESTPAAHVRNVQRIQTEQPRSLRSINPDVPPWFVAAVEKALRKAPDERFSGAEELLDALHKKARSRQGPTPVIPGEKVLEPGPLGRDEPARDDPIKSPLLPPEPAPYAPQKGAGPGLSVPSVWAWALGGLATLVLLLGGVIWLQGRNGAPPESETTLPATTEGQATMLAAAESQTTIPAIMAHPTESIRASEPAAAATQASPTDSNVTLEPALAATPLVPTEPGVSPVLSDTPISLMEGNWQ